MFFNVSSICDHPAGPAVDSGCAGFRGWARCRFFVQKAFNFEGTYLRAQKELNKKQGTWDYLLELYFPLRTSTGLSEKVLLPNEQDAGFLAQIAQIH